MAAATLDVLLLIRFEETAVCLQVFIGLGLRLLDGSGFPLKVSQKGFVLLLHQDEITC